VTGSRLLYRLRFRTPVGVFTGLGIAGLVDRIVIRDARGLPYVPGSSVKGRLRFFAERLLRSGEPPAPFSVHPAPGPLCKTAAAACTLCRLFGNPALPGALRVGNARPEEPWATLAAQLLRAAPNPVVHADAELRPGLALSRLRRTALADHLFFDETVPAAAFAGEMALVAGLSNEEVAWLAAVGRLVDGLGARKAAGRGRLAGGVEIGGGTP
jgi:CRISPR/Cas system CSM-associated protein Csm3 (group 7 of RAMP superfamily)